MSPPELPIPTASPAQQKEIERIVEKILAVKKAAPDAKGGTGIPACPSGSRKDTDENVCATLEREIDQLVYALYGLTPDEISLVEESNPA